MMKRSGGSLSARFLGIRPCRRLSASIVSNNFA
jgi:hypothetical protein